MSKKMGVVRSMCSTAPLVGITSRVKVLLDCNFVVRLSSPAPVVSRLINSIL